MCGFLASAGIQDHDMSEAKGNVHQRHPKWKYHRTGKSIVVQNSDAKAALGEGWGDSPAGPFIPQDAVLRSKCPGWPLYVYRPRAAIGLLSRSGYSRSTARGTNSVPKLRMLNRDF